MQSNYSDGEEVDEEVDDDDDEKEDQEEIKKNDSDVNQEERLENVENQKISSEKLNNNLRRLQVDFDGLSVVDEEEELKTDKDSLDLDPKSALLKIKHNYYAECPFSFRTVSDKSSVPACLHICNTICASRLNAPDLSSISPEFKNIYQDQGKNPVIGWQSNLLVPGINDQVPSSSIPCTDTRSLANENNNFTGFEITKEPPESLAQFKTHLDGDNYSINPSLLNKKNLIHKQRVTFTDLEDKKQGDTLSDLKTIEKEKLKRSITETISRSLTARPKHFFAPLPSKIKTISNKGAADVYLSGAVPFDRRQFFSPKQLVTGENPSNSKQRLVKSISCQDFSYNTQNSLSAKKIKSINSDSSIQHTKSDDNLSDSQKPFKSQLSVTLRYPRTGQSSSQEILEIPNVPSNKYNFFSNSFLKSSGYTCSLGQNFIYATSHNIQPNDLNGTETPKNVLFGVPKFNQLADNEVRHHEYQVTSFEGPNPLTLQIPPLAPINLDALRRLRATSPLLTNPVLCQNVPFEPVGSAICCPGQGMKLYYNSDPGKLSAQTEIPKEDESQKDKKDTTTADELKSKESTPDYHGKKYIKKEKSFSISEERPLSPTTLKKRDKLKKQIYLPSCDEPESPNSTKTGHKPRKSTFTATSLEVPEDKNESRSSSSGLDSPRKEQIRCTSVSFNKKKRPSTSSVTSLRTRNRDNSKERRFSRRDNLESTNCERERTNSVSSREINGVKERKISTSSDSVPWCACWGNGCV